MKLVEFSFVYITVRTTIEAVKTCSSTPKNPRSFIWEYLTSIKQTKKKRLRAGFLKRSKRALKFTTKFGSLKGEDDRHISEAPYPCTCINTAQLPGKRISPPNKQEKGLRAEFVVRSKGALKFSTKFCRQNGAMKLSSSSNRCLVPP